MCIAPCLHFSHGLTLVPSSSLNTPEKWREDRDSGHVEASEASEESEGGEFEEEAEESVSSISLSDSDEEEDRKMPAKKTTPSKGKTPSKSKAKAPTPGCSSKKNKASMGGSVDDLTSKMEQALIQDKWSYKSSEEGKPYKYSLMPYTHPDTHQ